MFYGHYLSDPPHDFVRLASEYAPDIRTVIVRPGESITLPDWDRRATGRRAKGGPCMSADDAPTPSGSSRQKKGGLEGIPVVGPVWSWYRGYSRRNGALLSAGIAYYGLFSLAPLMLLTLQITGLFIGESTAQQELSETLEAYLGPYLADLFTSVLFELQGRGSSTTLAVIGILLLIYGATKLFLRLQASFNMMWDIQVRPTRFSFRRVLSRLFAFTLVLAPTVILVVSLVLNAGISWLESITGTSGPSTRPGRDDHSILVGLGSPDRHLRHPSRHPHLLAGLLARRPVHGCCSAPWAHGFSVRTCRGRPPRNMPAR